jgi:dihydroneopterin aldolase
MSDAIKILGISATGYHGVFPEERREGQPFICDITLYFDLSPAGATDNLSMTVDYGAVAKVVEAEITGDAVDLIERLATIIADKILDTFLLVDSVEVTIHKPLAPVGVTVSDIAVTIERVR